MGELTAAERALLAALREDRPMNLSTLRGRVKLSERAFERAVDALVEAGLARRPTPGRLIRVPAPERGAAPGAALEELRLTAFKSFRGAALPLRALTLLVGRNGSGKSNALDGLDALSRLAGGDDIRDALEGRREPAHGVRGGVDGCAPAGEDHFALGCTVRTGSGRLDLDVEIQVHPEVQVVREELWEQPDGGRRRRLLGIEFADPRDAMVDARVHSGRRGPGPVVSFRASRLLVTQVATRVPLDRGTQAVHDAAARVLEALRAVFILDPVPSAMRQYWPAEDHLLRRDGANLSAAVASLRRDRRARRRLVAILAALPAQEVLDVTVERAPRLGDVMLVIQERVAGEKRLFPARLMSDGMLRFLAFAVALLQAPQRGDGALGAGAQRTLVIEEVENGLHPSQARQVIRLIKEECASRSIRTLATTHNPALLTALDPEDHEGVVLCDRDPGTGASRLRPIVDLPTYPAALAKGSLGDAVARDALGGEDDVDADLAALDRFLAEL